MKRPTSSIAELRPTLVIGVGGTGYLGVTSVKDKMMQMLPELVGEGFVRFQVIDTPSQKGPQAAAVRIFLLRGL